MKLLSCLLLAMSLSACSHFKCGDSCKRDPACSEKCCKEKCKGKCDHKDGKCSKCDKKCDDGHCERDAKKK